MNLNQTAASTINGQSAYHNLEYIYSHNGVFAIGCDKSRVDRKSVTKERGKIKGEFPV